MTAAERARPRRRNEKSIRRTGCFFIEYILQDCLCGPALRHQNSVWMSVYS